MASTPSTPSTPSVFKYLLRYAPLLLLMLLLIPLRISLSGKNQQQPISSQFEALPPFSPGSALYSITTSPNGEVWAVGGSFYAKSATGQFPLPASGMILHYVASSWQAATITKPLRLPLLSVSLDSPRDGWAVGWNGVLVHYDGSTWSTITGPANFNQNLLGVVMLSAMDGWAVGYSGSILHYDGKQWRRMQSPTQLDLHAIAMLSAQEGWAVGDRGTILHFHHGIWSVVYPSPTKNMLRSITILSSAEGWSVGDSGTILHYRNGIWEGVGATNEYRNPSFNLFGIAMDSIRSGWIIGDQHLLTYSSEVWIDSNLSTTTAKNSKYLPATPNFLSLYSIVTSPTGAGWAVGRVSDHKLVNNTFIILRLQDGKWYKSLILI